MNQELTVRAKYSTEDYVKALTYMQSRRFMYKYGSIVVFAIVFTAIVLLILLMANDKSGINFFAMMFFALLPALFVGGADYLVKKIVSPLILKRTISKQLKSSPALQEEQNIMISNEGIKYSNNLTSSAIKWEAVIEALESEADFLFYTSSRFAHFIPKNAFVSEIDVDYVRCLARAKLGDKAAF